MDVATDVQANPSLAPQKSLCRLGLEGVIPEPGRSSVKVLDGSYLSKYDRFGGIGELGLSTENGREFLIEHYHRFGLAQFALDYLSEKNGTALGQIECSAKFRDCLTEFPVVSRAEFEVGVREAVVRRQPDRDAQLGQALIELALAARKTPEVNLEGGLIRLDPDRTAIFGDRFALPTLVDQGTGQV